MVSTTADATTALPGTLPDRPFGVHFRMARWKSLIVLIAAPVVLFVAQIILFQVAALIEGPAEPGNTGLSPLQITATGLSTAITAFLTTVMVAKMAKVSWRAVFRHTRRFDWRRVGVYLLGSAALVGLGALATALIAPGPPHGERSESPRPRSSTSSSPCSSLPSKRQARRSSSEARSSPPRAPGSAASVSPSRSASSSPERSSHWSTCPSIPGSSATSSSSPPARRSWA